jgi:peptidoglycan/xylan/chitin deacetylase (PgdA/CDA1 family)
MKYLFKILKPLHGRGIKARLRKLYRNRIEIIVYHMVTSNLAGVLEGSHNVHPEVFEKQIAYLKQRYTMIPLSRVPDFLESKSLSGAPYAVVCFDDGHLNNISEAYPILERHQVPATLFVCPSVIGNQGLLWRHKIAYLIQNQLEQEFLAFIKKQPLRQNYRLDSLEQQGFYRWSKDPSSISVVSIQNDLTAFFEQKGISAAAIAQGHHLYISENELKKYSYLEFGNHTWSHPIMSCLSYQEQEKEIVKAHGYFEDRGLQVSALALPFSPFNEDTVQICKKLGYQCLLTRDDRINPIRSERRRPYILNRKIAPETLGVLHIML